MAAELNQNRFGAGVCSTLEDLRAATEMLSAALGHPTTPISNTSINVNSVWYDGVTLINQFGTIIVPGVSNLIDVEDSGVAVGSFTIFDFGVGLSATDMGGGRVQIDATGAATVTILAGAGIAITGGDTINVDLAATDPCLEFDGSDDLKLQIAPLGGLEPTATGVRDKWRYFEVKGTATSAGSPHTGTVGIDNVTAINGETPVTMSSDVLTCFTEVDVYCADNDVLYATFTQEGVGLSSYWSIANMKNLRPILAGLPGYNPAESMLLGHVEDTIDTSQQKVEWSTIAGWLELIDGYNAAENQYLRNNAGAISWQTVVECPEP